MLRITVHDNPECTTVQLEGALVGPWVREATECWQRTRAIHRGSAVRFDLGGMLSIDDAGKAFLAAAHAGGAELIAYDCFMRAVVAEITRNPSGGCNCPEPPAHAIDDHTMKSTKNERSLTNERKQQ